ncbi:unnamed protein product [Cuscuta europaea]|uniref:Uncharacterized protein n=1 Tax=Cuscuta europaea TaxID=41803 RepID=A0A9P0ZEP9_CUSEU|nr:unnamed protein product [Cuscuta europaea]
MATIIPTTPVFSLTASTHFPIKLTTSNFPVWKCQVHSALVGLGLDAYVDGTLSASDQYMDTAKTQINPCYTIWYRQDKTIVSALLGSCTDTIQPLLSSATTARQAWEKLALTYASTSRDRIISLKTTLARTTKGNRPVILAEMYALSEALALAQCPQSEEDLVINILNGLGSEYSGITSAIRVRETALPLTQLQDILLRQALLFPRSTPLIWLTDLEIVAIFHLGIVAHHPPGEGVEAILELTHAPTQIPSHADFVKTSAMMLRLAANYKDFSETTKYHIRPLRRFITHQ